MIVLFGKTFESHAKNYVQWGSGWYEDSGVKSLILRDYLSDAYSTLEFINDLLIELPKICEQYQNLSKTKLLEKLSIEI